MPCPPSCQLSRSRPPTEPQRRRTWTCRCTVLHRSSFIMAMKSSATSPNMLAASFFTLVFLFARLSKSSRACSCLTRAASASSVLLWKRNARILLQLGQSLVHISGPPPESATSCISSACASTTRRHCVLMRPLHSSGLKPSPNESVPLYGCLSTDFLAICTSTGLIVEKLGSPQMRSTTSARRSQIPSMASSSASSSSTPYSCLSQRFVCAFCTPSTYFAFRSAASFERWSLALRALSPFWSVPITRPHISQSC
mmetsp:Transcript_19923/g.49138  ORF Transcript_19923/g.49138 Transcript_19923/m.49138 type:complete len:255 (-) Transcript_19923:95-859(-)